MPDWWFYSFLILAVVSVLVCVWAAVVSRGPHDFAVVSVALLVVFVLVFGVVSVVRVMMGESIGGAAWEYWGYGVTAVVLPVGVTYWALLERSRFSNVVLALIGPVLVVMLYRMEQIWYGVSPALGGG